MAYIREYAGGWRVEIQKHGNRLSKLCSTKAEARQWALTKEAELDHLKLGAGITFGSACDRYLSTVTTKKKEGAEAWERRQFVRMKEFFGERTPLAKISKSRIAEWRDERLKTVKGSTVDREANLLRALFTKAKKEWEVINHYPFEGVKMPNDNEAREHVWRWRDIRRVLRHCQTSIGPKTQQVGVAFHIALRTAMRLKEVLSAKKVGNIIVIYDSKTTKAGKGVEIPTTYQGRRTMDKYKDVVFTVGSNEASTIFHTACVECGVRTKGDDGPTFHDSRATALTLMSRKMPVQRLQRISRHRDINILTNTYYRETAEEISATL